MEFTSLKKHSLNLNGFDNVSVSQDPSEVQKTVSNHTGDQETNVRVYTPESLADLKQHMLAIAELNEPSETEKSSLQTAMNEVKSLKKDIKEVDGVAYPVYTTTHTNED